MSQHSPSVDSYTFSSRQTFTVIAIILFGGILSPLSSLIYTPALPAIANGLGISISDVNLTVTTYLIFQGLTPSIWGSISDVFGRRPVYLLTFLITFGASVGLCLTESFTVVLVLRALYATGCSCTNSLGFGVIRDMIPISKRGGYIGLYSACIGVGTAFGPLLGGVLAQYASWHGIFYFTLALSVASFLSIFFFLPETLASAAEFDLYGFNRYLQPPTLLKGQPISPGKQDRPVPIRRLDFLGPLRMMKHPDVLCGLLVTGIFYTVWQNSMVATATIYAEQYGLSEAQIGLTYLANGIGAFTGYMFIGRVLDHDYQRQMQIENSKQSDALTIEHARMRSLMYNVPLFTGCMLAFGWIIQHHVHISASITIAFCIGWTDVGVLAAYSTLMVDLFETSASTSSAAINLVRCLLAAIGTSTIQLMINAMGVGRSFTTLTGILVLSFPLIWYQYTYGQKHRSRRLKQKHSIGTVTPKEYGVSDDTHLPPSSFTSEKEVSSTSLVSQVDRQRQLAYWASHLTGARALELRTDYLRPKTMSGTIDKVPFSIDETLTVALSELAAANLTSLHVVLLAAFRAAILRVSGEDSGVIGMLNVNLQNPKLFETAHPINISVEAQSTFKELISETRSVAIAALEHSDVSFDEIIAHLAPPVDSSRNALMQLMFSLRDLSESSANRTMEPLERLATRFDLSLHLVVRGNELRGCLMYQRDLFFPSTIHTLSDVIQRVIRAAIQTPYTPLSRLPLTTVDDLDKLSVWNDTRIDSPDTQISIGDIFRRVANQYPTSIAVVDGTVKLTYSMVNEQTDRLASWIIQKGFPVESVIGVHMGRSALLVVVYLGCLKAGMAFMPLDKTLPPERMRQMVATAHCPLIFASGHTSLSDDVLTVKLTHDSEVLRSTPIISLPAVSPRNLSNVVFTSGSTGVPKGVMVEHRGMINLCSLTTTNWAKKMRNGLTTSIGFDPSGFQIFTSLLSGSELHCLPDHGMFDVVEFQSFVVDSEIQRFYATPSMLNALLEDQGDWLERSSLQQITLGGEKLVPSQISDVLRRVPHLEVASSYGPAEASVRSAYSVIDPSWLESHMSRIPIGRALPNTQLYIVDESFDPVPPGVLGQIVVTGVHLARGYLNRPDLTAERFVRTLKDSLLGPKRLYCTGDLGYWTSDGQVQFVGRMDTQLKVRGQRLEAGEVETAIDAHPAVESSAVVVVAAQSGDQLIAYVRLNVEASTRKEANNSIAVLSALKEHLKRTLPPYMVPNQIIIVDALPLNSNGKLDRKLLATCEYMDSLACSQDVANASDAVRPIVEAKSLTADEISVRDIFARSLGISPHTIDLHDNLFDLGGHSLIAARIITAVRQQFGLIFGVALFYSNASVSGVIAHLAQCKTENEVSPTYLPMLGDLCPASDSQTRLWVEEQMYPGLAQYHVGFQRKLIGPFNVEAFSRAFLALLERHEALRTVFEMCDSSLMQHVLPVAQCPPVRFVDLQLSSPPVAAEQDARAFLVEEHGRPFDLAKDIPIRLVVLQISSDIHFISAVNHHIATDGWSNGIIDKDLTHLYNSFAAGKQPILDPLPLRYRDYSVWERKRVREGNFQGQLEYWAHHLQDSKPLELCVDYLRPQQMLSGNAAEIPVTIGEKSVTALRQLAAKHRTSLNVILLAAFRATVFRVTGEEDGSIGMVNANRPRQELESIVGFFVNTHAIRLPLDRQSSFDDLIIETRKATTAALDNSEIPFDKVVAHLAPHRDLARNPLVQLIFILQDFTGISESNYGHGFDGVTVEDIRNATTQLDLSLHLYVEGRTLRGFFMYQTDLFFSSTIQTLSNAFQRIIEVAVMDPQSSLSTLPLTTVNDMKELALWNETSVNSPDLELSLGDRFRRVAAQYSSSMAVVDTSVSLTYSMLDAQSDCLASWIVQKGFPAESVIGVHMGRSALLVVAYLGCLKSGMAYMPLDKTLPVDRIRLMVQESRCPLIITSEEEDPLAGEILTLDLTHDNQILHETRVIQLPTISSNSLSNIMFTSGSTGVPKGVMLEHQGMVNLCAPETTNWAKKRKNGLTTNVGFDPSGAQIFTSLLSGSELHCLPDGGMFDVEEFRKFITSSGIQRCSLTSSVLSALINTTEDWLSHSSLEHIALGGEKLVVSQIVDCSRRLPRLEFASEYGPVEASIWSTYFVIDSSELDTRMCRIPIGRALPNTHVYVVDETFAPVPAGILGQIVLAGVHLARGYLNRPDLTAERFIQLPEDSLLGPQRLYCTGDLGYWTSDGQLQFVGRMDTQVKIRGQRLEVEEVETVLEGHPAVDASAVAVVPTQHGDQLVAYVRIAGEAESREEAVLSLWKHHYDRKELYGELDDDSAAPDVTIWVSMYTGEPIPVGEMEEWLEDTISQIPTSPADRALELGVGTGKIAMNVVNRVASFVGSDLSPNALEFLQTQIEHKGLSSKLSVFQGAAHEFERLPNRNYSLALLNSVAQYFPSIEYLTQIISNLIDLMPEGRVFIGDVRSYALIPFHNLERILATFDDDMSVSDIRDALQGYDEVQTELLISPSFFFELQVKFPRIVHVEIKPKYMATRNELSRYRYNVVLHIGARPALITPDTWVECGDMKAPVSALRTKLRESSDGVVGALNIVVDDVEQVHALFNIVHSPNAAAETVLTLRQRLLDEDSRAQSTPASLVNMAKEEGWNVVLDASFQGISGNRLRAIFVRGVNDPVGDFPVPKLSGPAHNTFPVAEVDVSPILNAIEEHLRDTLPPYMVPNRFISVEKLPLNRSGKLDRKVLSSPEYLESHETLTVSDQVEPVTELERQVMAIFARALNCQPETVHIRKSFFNLGGHSLMATLVIAAIRRELGINLSIVDFFRHPTVKDIAALISTDTLQTPSSFDSKTKAESVGANATIVFNNEHPGPTLFMFPEATGFASVYSSAIEDIGHKVVAFGDERWGELPDPDENITSVVAALIPTIRDCQPHGPYFLSGWSLGGLMALEAAIQLQAAGESVQLVMMFDSNLDNRPLDPLSVPRSQWRAALDPLLHIVDDKASWLNQLTRANRMMAKHVFDKEAYTGRVILVKAGRGRDPGEVNPPAPDPLNGWGEFFENMEVLSVDSTHRGMFDSVNGPRVGKMIHDALQ